MATPIKIIALIIPVVLPLLLSAADFNGYAGVEVRHFLQGPLDNMQHGDNVSITAEPEFFHEWDNGNQSIAFVPYARWDLGDGQRTHMDIRELTWIKVSESWEFRAGIGKVFWGVMEFQHLVDIINQTDLVENIDTEDKLGQPMLNLALVREWGTLDFFLMPYFRERTYPGIKGRHRTIPVIDDDSAVYESSARERHIDFAIRYYHTISDWDIGISHFYGTSRDPRLQGSINSKGSPVLVPYYEVINQTSLDLQLTRGNTSWKLEALHRSGQGSTYNAIGAGFEYTFTGILGSGIDLGLLGEYHYDARGKQAPTLFDDDLGIGMRLSFNDIQSSALLAGLVIDRDTGTIFINIEASRRFGQSWVGELQARLLTDQSPVDPLYSFNNDDYLELFLSYHF